MTGLTKVLALMDGRFPAGSLPAEAAAHLTTCYRTEAFLDRLNTEEFPVVLLPATLPSEDWWRIWGALNTMELCPSILAYAQHSDFPRWSGLLEAGCFDLVVAPFTQEKLWAAISDAARDFDRRRVP